MSDVMYVALTVVFFALAVGLVRACDRVIGPDEDPVPTPDAAIDDELADMVGAPR